MNKQKYDKNYAVIVVDKDFNIASTNYKAVEEYGDIVGKKCHRVFNDYEKPCDEISPYVCPIRVLQNTSLKKFTSVYAFNRKRGNYVYLTVKKEGEHFVQEHINLNGNKLDILDVNSILKNLYEGIVIIDSNSRKIKMINKKFISIFNIKADEEYFLEKDVKEIQKYLPQSISNIFDRKEFLSGEEFVVHYKGKYLIIKVININGNYKLWSFIEKEEIDLGDEIFRILLETTQVGIFLQCGGRFMYANPTLSSMLETMPGELIGAKIDKYIYSKDRKKILKIAKKRESNKNSVEKHTLRITTGTGKMKWIEVTSKPISFKGKDCSIGSVIDITDRKELEENLRKLATIDQLTGIYNRYAFEKFFEKEINRAERYKTKFSIIMFDIDNFKNINDIYGHQIGDRVLKEIVKVVKKNIRKSDIFARWGGEEFMILVPIKNRTDAYKIAEKIRKKIEKHRFDGIKNITISIGVAFYKEGDSIKTVIRRADTALYQAKKSGKNVTVVSY